MHGLRLVMVMLLACSCNVRSTGTQRLCQQVCQQVTHDVCDMQDDVLLMQPRQGKKGPRGEKGEPGSPGTVDVDGVVATVLARIDEGIDALNDKVDDMQTTIDQNSATIANLRQEVEDSRKRQDLCKVFYGGKCFWSVIEGSVNQREAQEICSNSMGAKLANVYSRLHYDMLMDYMRPLIGPDDYRDYVWFGMKYNTETRQVTYDNGTRAAFVKWHRGYPDDRVEHTEMCFLVAKAAGSADEGFYNQPVKTTKKGVLCEL